MVFTRYEAKTKCFIAEVGGQCVVGLQDKELGRLFEEGGQVIIIARINIDVNDNDKDKYKDKEKDKYKTKSWAGSLRREARSSKLLSSSLPPSIYDI